MKLSNQTYDTLKWVAQLLLPGLATLYFALSSIWGLPYGEQIVGTITAIDAFLGLLLGLSASAYKASGAGVNGTLQIDPNDPTKAIYRLQLNEDLSNLANKTSITLKVDPNVDLTSK